ncbi:hypothetical protein EC973_002434 [Apophysomyces ossiformis]|uniref:Uncharacterized protein n=1 Tax=Apophysomyces ossiformis TaxID=679940 RepID=A0A8H7BGN9_9FUNG|nr:hypothetical protein EC973_002434 [Apophysomyces ossiformis]
MAALFRHLTVKSRGIAGLRRSISTTSSGSNYAFAFDIDGVLIKGNRTIPQAKRSVPYVLLTNGGGVTEAKKAEQISQMLDIEIRPEQVVLSHSPMRQLATKYKEKQVLVIGGKGLSCYHVARGYGFNRVVVPEDIHNWNPSAWPYSQPSEALTSGKYDFSETPIDAVMVFHDARDWGRDLQLILDVLCSENGIVGSLRKDYSLQNIPIYFSNNDIIWSTDFPAPRMGQGSFKVAVERLYETLTGFQLKSTSFGKPHATTYAYAERTIQSLGSNSGKNEGRPRVYAVGDNPAADIKGANAYGWTSILVRTGVFVGPGNSPIYPADAVCDNVEEAVLWAIEQEESSKR